MAKASWATLDERGLNATLGAPEASAVKLGRAELYAHFARYGYECTPRAGVEAATRRRCIRYIRYSRYSRYTMPRLPRRR